MVVAAKPRASKKQKVELQAETWLAEVGFSAEQVAELKEKFTPAQMAKIAEGYMRTDDFSRRSDERDAEMAKAQEDLQKANERLNKEMAEWATLQQSGKTATAKMQADLEAAQARVATLTQRAQKIATDAGLDPAKALEGIDVTPTPKPEDTKPDLSGYVKADDLDALVAKRVGNLATGMLDIPAELFQLGQEHQALFGEALDTRAVVEEIKSRAKNPGNDKALDPRAVWEELHGVTDKRAEVAKEQHDAEIAAAVEKGRQEARSEASLPGGTSLPGRHAAVFGEEGRKSALERPQPMTTVNAAATALRSGKYRTGTESGTKEGAAAT